LNREERELRWHIPDIPLKGPTGRLRARMPVDQDSSEGELDVIGMVRFSGQGLMSLSGVSIKSASEAVVQFAEVSHTYSSGNYLCL
jgi:hypothetical protein